MILLVASSSQALPALPVTAAYRRLILHGRREAAERQLRAELDRRHYELVISAGFAAAADHRLAVADLLQATRVFGGADVYIDLPPFQAPGAIRGSICSLPISGEAPPATGLVQAVHSQPRRLPPVYAFDDHAFWLARITQASDTATLVLRAMLVPAARPGSFDPLLVAGRRFTPSTLLMDLARQPRRWREFAAALRSTARCRRQLATTLTILLMLHDARGQAAPRRL
ncbi:MAG: hypothetical protein JOZ39_09905 [Chloroflexi bacterium]|nr:hypothetical protein [Chloroflexota bacterium]